VLARASLCCSTYIRAGSTQPQLQRSIVLGPSTNLLCKQLQIKSVPAASLHSGGTAALLPTGQTFLPLQLAQTPTFGECIENAPLHPKGQETFLLLQSKPFKSHSNSPGLICLYPAPDTQPQGSLLWTGWEIILLSILRYV